MSIIVVPQTEQTQIESISNSPIVFLKAEMSPSKPDLKRHYMQNCHVGEYKNRRFTAEGVNGKTLIIGTFKITGDKLIDKANLPDQLYSVDVIVPMRKEYMLSSLARMTVQAGLGVIAGWETIETQVGVLKRNDKNALKLTTPKSNIETFSYGESKVKCTYTTVEGFARLLSITSVGMPIVDETNIKGQFDFDIEWQEGNLDLLNERLNELGLRIIVEERPIKLVVVRPANIQ